MTGHTLSYGVYLPPFGPFGDPPVLVDLAVRAEAAGWDGVFLWDHVVYEAMPIHFDPLELSLEIVDAGPPRL